MPRDLAAWSVLDIGCNAGFYSVELARRGFDFVWFTGVFYHLRYPTLALDLVRRTTRRLMMFQSMTMPGAPAPTPPDLALDERERLLDERWPKMAFIEHRLACDPTNQWVPSAGCVEALLRTAGFEILERPAHEFYLCRPLAGEGCAELEHVLDAARARRKPRAAVASRDGMP